MSDAHLWIDIEGTALTPPERALLHCPCVAGVVLFARNYTDPAQLARLTAELRAERAAGIDANNDGGSSSSSSPRRALTIAVDHEGGRVQRFRTGGFTPLPPAGHYRRAPTAAAAEEAAWCGGWVMASELLACGVDLSLAPVLDVAAAAGSGACSAVIGDRAFGATAAEVEALAGSFLRGVAAAGMRSCGKHFPGHGAAAGDSHAETPVDARPAESILSRDAVVFERLLPRLAAVMPAHVVYPAVDARWPASGSAVWLRGVLRGRMGFRGVVCSDDVFMHGADALAAAEGATGAEDARDKEEEGNCFARSALTMARAGCQVILACRGQRGTLRDVGAIVEALAPLSTESGYAATVAALAPMRPPQPEVAAGRPALALLQQSEKWQRCTAVLGALSTESSALAEP